VFFNKDSKKVIQIPVERGMYAWNSMYAGSFILYVGSQHESYKFIFLPGPTDFFLTPENFDTALKTHVLEFVEQLPLDVYNETVNFSLTCPTT
jgi:hypothetical protein